MARHAEHIGFPLVGLLRGAGLPLRTQLYARLRDCILQGAPAPGSRVPSSRCLAEHLHIARNTAQAALEQLCAEGYTETRHGGGTYVSPQVQWEQVLSAQGPSLHRRRQAPLVDDSLAVDRSLGAGLPLAPGAPLVPERLRTLWARLLALQCRRGEAGFGYGDPRGLGELRTAIARHLVATRAVRCEADQILLFSSSQQAFDLLLRFVQAAPGVAMEDPGHQGFRLAVQASGRPCFPVGLDAGGIEPARIPQGVGMVFVTPSCQYPTGQVMPLERRMQLLAWAGRTGNYLVEYDYLGALRYFQHPQPSLQGLDREESVLYVGTCSEALFPAVRTTYLVVPRHLLDRLGSAREAVGGFTPLLEQAALAELFAAGHLDSHLRRVRKDYDVRREILHRELEARLGEQLDLQEGDASLHAILWLPRGQSDREIAHLARQRGLGVVPLSALTAGAVGRPGLLVGHTAASKLVLAHAAGLLGEIVSRQGPSRNGQGQASTLPMR